MPGMGLKWRRSHTTGRSYLYTPRSNQYVVSRFLWGKPDEFVMNSRKTWGTYDHKLLINGKLAAERVPLEGSIHGRVLVYPDKLTPKQHEELLLHFANEGVATVCGYSYGRGVNAYDLDI